MDSLFIGQFWNRHTGVDTPVFLSYSNFSSNKTHKHIMTATATASLSTIEINGVVYAPIGSGASTLPVGNRQVCVIDRGWIVAGDVTKDDVTGELIVTNPIHVFRWESIGFDGVLKNPKDSKVTLKTLPYPVKVPAGSVIFTIPVPADWGV